MASDANNGGSNIKWLFVVVLQGACCFIFGCSLGTSLWVGCFSQVAAHRVSSYIQLVLLCWCFPGDTYYFSIPSNIQQYFRTFFSGYFLILFIIIFIFLSTSVYSLLQVWSFYNCHIHILLQCPVLFYLIWLICYLLNLPCVILLSFTLKIFFPQDFSLLFEINYRNCEKYFM